MFRSMFLVVVKAFWRRAVVGCSFAMLCHAVKLEALFMVTVFMGASIVTNSLSALVVLAEMDEAPWWKLGGYVLCILGMMAGLVLLTEGEKDPTRSPRGHANLEELELSSSYDVRDARDVRGDMRDARDVRDIRFDLDARAFGAATSPLDWHESCARLFDSQCVSEAVSFWAWCIFVGKLKRADRFLSISEIQKLPWIPLVNHQSWKKCLMTHELRFFVPVHQIQLRYYLLNKFWKSYILYYIYDIHILVELGRFVEPYALQSILAPASSCEADVNDLVTRTPGEIYLSYFMNIV